MIRSIDYPGICVTFFCHDGKGNVLLGKRGPGSLDEHGKWDQGAGAVELMHSLHATLEKEIREEYSTTVEDVTLLGYRDVFRHSPHGESHWLAMDFLVLIGSEVANLETDEHGKAVLTEIKWFKIDRMPPMHELHSEFRKCLKLYADSIHHYLKINPATIWVDRQKAL